MELVVYLFVLWAMMVPFRLFFTAMGSKKRGGKLFVVFLLSVGIADVFDIPDRWMLVGGRPERVKAKAAEARREPARATDKARARRDTSRGREASATPAPSSNPVRRREEAAARRARARYEAEQRRLEQNRTEQPQSEQQR